MTEADFLHRTIFSQQFIDRNTENVGKVRKQKDIGIAYLPFPFGDGECADTEERSKLALAQLMLLAVVYYALGYTNLVHYFTLLYISWSRIIIPNAIISRRTVQKSS